MVNGIRSSKSMAASGGQLEGGSYKGQHYAINTRTSLTMGYTASGGEAYSAMIGGTAEKFGGLQVMETSLRGWAIAKTTGQGVLDTANTIRQFGTIGMSIPGVRNLPGVKAASKFGTGAESKSGGGGSGSNPKGNG
ncbi:hypothetical protein BKH44_08485 [Helicobacter sp. 13S00477-4]|nr:hypothetical protein BKH44_08485 [Helicobacter sp. 13S00477-4]